MHAALDVNAAGLRLPSRPPPPPPRRAPTAALLCVVPCRSLADLFASDPGCAAAKKQDKGKAGLARTHQFAGAGLDDELELKKLQVGLVGEVGPAAQGSKLQVCK